VLSRAKLAAGRGQSSRAADLFARSAQAWQELPRPYDALLAAERQAHCLVQAGQVEAGLPVLSEAFAGLAELGARGDAMRVMHALRGHGVEVKRPWWGGRRGYGDQLSPRELDVVRLLVSGRTNRDIASVLYLSPKTVAGHVDAAMRKLRVTSRTALAVRVVEAGIVQAEAQDAG
jgi:DNA-binding NarL/FixJ family response regulator